MIFHCIRQTTLFNLDKMDGLQNEILVVFLYLTLIYEIFMAIKRQARKIEKKLKSKFPPITSTRSKSCSIRRNINRKHSNEVQSSLTRQSSRHFVQMRLIAWKRLNSNLQPQDYSSRKLAKQSLYQVLSQVICRAKTAVN